MLACKAQYSAESAAKESWVLCLGQSCSSECYCASKLSDPGCNGCLAQSCCKELAAWDTAPSGIEYAQCTGACSDATCAAACGQTYPAAATAGNALSACQAQLCSASCGP
jgi:hypothetical protein